MSQLPHHSSMTRNEPDKSKSVDMFYCFLAAGFIVYIIIVALVLLAPDWLLVVRDRPLGLLCH